MDYAPRPLLQTIVRSAVDATAARAGWLAVPVDGTQLAIVAAAAPSDPTLVDRLLWQRTAVAGSAGGLVMQSGQPVALGGSAAGRTDNWAETLLGRSPSAVVCVPCSDEEQPVAVLELIDKSGGGAFNFDDVELAAVLASIAGAAISEGVGGAMIPTPAQLSADLNRLASADPDRYAAVAAAVVALVSQA
jgi:GAF domain-containing protein